VTSRDLASRDPTLAPSPQGPVPLGTRSLAPSEMDQVPEPDRRRAAADGLDGPDPRHPSRRRYLRRCAMSTQTASSRMSPLMTYW
jgi:hypothetical protein